MKKAIISTQTYKKRHSSLRKSEILALRQANIGYGNLISNARRVGIHENTYRYILDRGYGTTEIVRKIRSKLL